MDGSAITVKWTVITSIHYLWFAYLCRFVECDRRFNDSFNICSLILYILFILLLIVISVYMYIHFVYVNFYYLSILFIDWLIIRVYSNEIWKLERYFKSWFQKMTLRVFVKCWIRWYLLAKEMLIGLNRNQCHGILS